jgi:hypothetical protein
MMFTDSNGWTYQVGELDGRATPALYRTKTGEPLEVLGYFKGKEEMWVFVEALRGLIDPTSGFLIINDGPEDQVTAADAAEVAEPKKSRSKKTAQTVS